MIRKISLLFAGALMGASAMSLVYGVPGSAANAAGSDTYRQLNLRRRVRAHPRRLCRGAGRRRADRVRHQRHALLARSAFELPECRRTTGHAGADPGEFYGLGIEVTMENELIKVISPDRRHAGRQGRRARRRLSSPSSTARRCWASRSTTRSRRCAARRTRRSQLTILREGVDEPLKITVVRDVIRVQSVKYRVEDDIGYLRDRLVQRADDGGSREGDREDREPRSRTTS